MVDYSKLSGAEIAQKVFFWINDKICPIGSLGHFFNGEFFYSANGQSSKKFDPCNNPADAWQIIVENKIMLSPRCANDEWKAQIHLGREDIFDNYASAWHKNPLRAAMIVFLMMQEEK